MRHSAIPAARVMAMPLAVPWHRALAHAPLSRPHCRRDERMGMAAPVYYTADMVRAMPDDGNRYEVVYGELLVTPAPRPWHQVVIQRLLVALDKYLEREPVGLVLASPADISWGPDVLVQPDVFVVPRKEARTLTWSRMQTLLLVAEVLSASSTKADRFLKRLGYRETGVPLYWVVDGDERTVEVWTPADDFPAVERERLEWRPAGAAEPFTLRLGDLFRSI
jgi:Uma2 family endonuclease